MSEWQWPEPAKEHKSAQIDIKTSSTNLKLMPLNRSTNCGSWNSIARSVCNEMTATKERRKRIAAHTDDST